MIRHESWPQLRSQRRHRPRLIALHAPCVFRLVRRHRVQEITRVRRLAARDAAFDFGMLGRSEQLPVFQFESLVATQSAERFVRDHNAGRRHLEFVLGQTVQLPQLRDDEAEAVQLRQRLRLQIHAQLGVDQRRLAAGLEQNRVVFAAEEVVDRSKFFEIGWSIGECGQLGENPVAAAAPENGRLGKRAVGRRLADDDEVVFDDACGYKA